MTQILHKYNGSAGIVPDASELVPRELAINTADGKLYTKKQSGTVVLIGPGPTIYSGTTTPSNSLGSNGDLYFKY
jgi:hypothetical protein